MKPYYSHAGVTIYHGDCREVLPLLEEPFDVIFADPPFGIAYGGHGASKDGRAHRFEPIPGDGAVWTGWLEWLRLREGGALYLKTTWGVLPQWEAAVAARFDLKARIVWDKCSHTAGDVNGGYAKQAELLLFATAGRHRITRFDTDVWRIPRATLGAPEKRTGHPYEAPLELPARAIENSSRPGGRVLDPFFGSGPTLEAAKRLGRRAIGIEIEERYCELAANRLSQEVLELAL